MYALFHVVFCAFCYTVLDNKAAVLAFCKVIDNFVRFSVKIGVVGINNGIIRGVDCFEEGFNRGVILSTAGKENAFS